MATVFGGAVFASYIYDAWGNLEGYFGDLAQDIRFLYTGREYDWQTGEYHYRARSYDAELGRFLQRDPAGMTDGPNMYVYCGNDPVNRVDPGGMLGDSWVFEFDPVLDLIAGFSTKQLEYWKRCADNAVVYCDNAYRFYFPEAEISRDNPWWGTCKKRYENQCMASYYFGALLLAFHIGHPSMRERYFVI